MLVRARGMYFGLGLREAGGDGGSGGFLGGTSGYAVIQKLQNSESDKQTHDTYRFHHLPRPAFPYNTFQNNYHRPGL